MKYAPIFLTALLPLSTASAQDAAWRPDYATAWREAREKGRPLVVDVGSPNCLWCRRLDAVTFRDAAVARLVNDRFVPVRLDAVRDAAVLEKLPVRAYPTVFLADAEGNVLDIVEGFEEPGPFRERLERLLTPAAGRPGAVRDYEEASQALASSDTARALPLLRTALQDGGVRTKARQLLDELEAQAAGRLARAKTLAEQGQHAEAVAAVGELTRCYPGTAAAAEGEAWRARLVHATEAQQLRRQRAKTLLERARDDRRDADYAACLRRCEVLESSYPDMEETKEARRLAAEIRNRPEWLRQACDGLGDQLGVMSLALAEAWLKNGKPQQAILCLERVVQTLPGTRQAEAAQARLAQIQGLSLTRKP